MNPDAFVNFARGRIEGVFPDTCTIATAGTGDPTYDPDTGQIDNGDSDPVYTGACHVRPLVLASSRDRTVGEESVDIGRYEVKVPATVDVPDGALLTVTASRHDTALDGVSMVVRSVLLDGWVTFRRLICEDVNRGS